jgi:sporulation protein YlmC with PRC-barrel domain
MKTRNIIGISVVAAFLALTMFHLSWGQETALKTLFATDIIDRQVYDKQGKDIGEVDDLIVSRMGKVKKVTLDVGGFLGVGEKIIALSFNEVSFQKDGRIDADVTREKADKMPEYNYYNRGLERAYYGQCPYYPFNYPGSEYFYGPFYNQHPARELYAPRVWAYYPNRFLASTVLKRSLIDQRGEIIGKIDDLIIGRDGEVEKLVLSSPEYLTGGKHVTVPFERAGFTPLGVVYDITPEKLKSLPEFPYKE